MYQARAVAKFAKPRRPSCPEEAAFLDLLRTTDMLSRGLVQVPKTENIFGHAV
jgi:hypothetical protein